MQIQISDMNCKVKTCEKNCILMNSDIQDMVEFLIKMKEVISILPGASQHTEKIENLSALIHSFGKKTKGALVELKRQVKAGDVPKMPMRGHFVTLPTEMMDSSARGAGSTSLGDAPLYTKQTQPESSIGTLLSPNTGLHASIAQNDYLSNLPNVS